MLSSVKKTPVDLIVIYFKQMFHSEEVPIVLNTLYEAGIQNDIFALLYESSHESHIAVKTPTGLTERKTILNKIMQCDVLGPLVSSNMVDQLINKVALETGKFTCSRVK